MNEPPSIAVFADFENIAIGARDAGHPTLDVQRILERVLEKGKILVKRAYADWSRYREYKKPMHEAGFELVEVPHVSYSGKNSADIRLVVDALDMCHTKPHLGIFAILSGDSDFSPLVGKLRENGKVVLGIGVESSTSSLLVESCDDFVFYDELVGAAAGETLEPPMDQLLETVAALDRDRDGHLWGSMVKQALKRKKPGFSERRYGFRSFNALLEEAGKLGLLELQPDEKSGGYRITGYRGSA